MGDGSTDESASAAQMSTSSNWFPNEDSLAALLSMGISRNATERGLYYTGNGSADVAADWIFEHLNDPDLHSPLVIPVAGAAALGGLEMPDLSHKMVFVVDTSLGMGVGKIAAQVAHAGVGLYRRMISGGGRLENMVMIWQEMGETKIVLKAGSSEELMSLNEKAKSLNLPTFTVHDAGKTQIPAGSLTVLAIMGPETEVDKENEILQTLSKANKKADKFDWK